MITDTHHYAPATVETVDEFCKSNRISRAFFNKLRTSGQAPDLIKIGRRVLIAAEASAEWRKRFTVRCGQ